MRLSREVMRTERDWVLEKVKEKKASSEQVRNWESFEDDRDG